MLRAIFVENVLASSQTYAYLNLITHELCQSLRARTVGKVGEPNPVHPF